RMLHSLLGGAVLLALALPASAQAHGIVGKADLPIPVWLFSWTPAIVLVVSFVALSTLWRTPQLQEQRRRRLLGGTEASGRTSLSARVLDWLGGARGGGRGERGCYTRARL